MYHSLALVSKHFSITKERLGPYRLLIQDLPPKHRRLVRLALTAAASGLCEAETSASTDFERCGLLKLVAAESWLKEKLVSHCGGGRMEGTFWNVLGFQLAVVVV